MTSSRSARLKPERRRSTAAAPCSVANAAFATLHGAAAVDACARASSGAAAARDPLAPDHRAAAPIGPEAVSVVYGADFEDAGPVLVVLVLSLPAFSIWTISGALLTGMDDARSPVLASGVAAALNLALAFVLVPRYDAVGAAMANLAAQTLAAVVMLRIASRLVQAGSWDLTALIRPLLAAAGTWAAAWAILQGVDGGRGVILATLGGGIAFGALAFLLRILTADDADWLDEQIGHMLGGWMGCLVRLAGGRP